MGQPFRNLKEVDGAEGWLLASGSSPLLDLWDDARVIMVQSNQLCAVTVYVKKYSRRMQWSIFPITPFGNPFEKSWD